MAIIFFILIIILLPNPSTASDFISLNQSISGDEKLISKNGDFELGFFRPGNSPYYYIGIWYSLEKVPKLTSVWVANRETPISDLSKTELKISMNGNLVIANSSNPSIWSTKVASISSNATTVAILLDSGNLVLKDSANGNLTLWQSFDHPTDTWLPGAKLGLNKVTKESQRLTSWKNLNDPSAGRYSVTTDQLVSVQFVIQWNNKKTYWSSGNWDGRIFSSAPEMTANGLVDFDYVSYENEAYLAYSLNPNNPLILRWIIDMSGQMRQMIWIEDAAGWSTFWSHPIKQLDVYAFCGPFGSGNDNAIPFCNCIIGFEPKSLDEWLLSDYAQGCKRKSQLQCGFNRSHLEVDGYLPMDDIRLPDNPLRLYVDDISDCKNYCLSNCSCSAYYIADNSSCSFWVGDLLNLEDQYASDMSVSGNFFLRLAASELPDPKTKKSRKATVIIMVSIAGGVLLLACVVCFLWKMKKRIRRIKIKITLEATSGSNEHPTNGPREDNIELALFEVSTIVTATNYFSAANKLGVGGFGPVYKGILGPDQEVAVKRLSKASMQGVEEFKNEVTLIAKLQHRNLVRLHGCCIHREERMLIYEYMPNKSLDAFLFEKKGPLLDWKTRYQIILGVTRGLLYLHHDSRLRIIHRDLKASNILLDKNMNPKISDFGLARILTGDETTDFNTRKVVGTYGYMSPEYAMDGIFSMKSDVFSFGVLLLEIVSGRKNRGKYTYSTHLNLVAHAWSLWNEGKSLHLVDETLSDSYSEVEVMKCIKVGLLCVQEHATDRPLISSVIEFLANASDIASIPMPKRPGFISRTIPIETDSVSEIHEECTSNDITVSLEGR